MVKAMLILDPPRGPEQTAYVAARATIHYKTGNNLWVSMADDLASPTNELIALPITVPGR